jgi:hypothetical protein
MKIFNSKKELNRRMKNFSWLSRKSGQDQKSKIFSANLKRGQEEIVGFAVILVIVSVVILVLLWFLLSKPNDTTVESFEIESFVQTALQYTTDCEGNLEFLSIRELIIACEERAKCFDGRGSCSALNESLTEIIDSSWKVSNQSAIKGYKLNIYVNEEENLIIQKGNETTNYKGALGDFARSGNDYVLSLSVYY